MITDHNILLFILCSCIGFRNYEIDLFDVEFSSFFIFFLPKLQDSFITSDAMIFLFWQPIYRDFVFSFYEIERFFLWIHDFLKRFRETESRPKPRTSRKFDCETPHDKSQVQEVQETKLFVQRPPQSENSDF